MNSRAATCALVADALFVSAGSPTPRAAGDAVVEKNFTIKLKIRDEASGLTVEAKKAVAKGTSAFDAVRHVVAMGYRTDPEIGPVVTSLCGSRHRRARPGRAASMGNLAGTSAAWG